MDTLPRTRAKEKAKPAREVRARAKVRAKTGKEKELPRMIRATYVAEKVIGHGTACSKTARGGPTEKRLSPRKIESGSANSYK